MVTLVTDWSLLTLGVIQEVAALVGLAEHHGLPLPVIGTEDVVRLRVTVGAVPVVPGGLENSHYETSRRGVERQTCSCSGQGRCRAPGGCSPPPGPGADSPGPGWWWWSHSGLGHHRAGLHSQHPGLSYRNCTESRTSGQLDRSRGSHSPGHTCSTGSRTGGPPAPRSQWGHTRSRQGRCCRTACHGKYFIKLSTLRIFLFYLLADERPARQRRVRVLK